MQNPEQKPTETMIPNSLGDQIATINELMAGMNQDYKNLLSNTKAIITENEGLRAELKALKDKKPVKTPSNGKKDKKHK